MKVEGVAGKGETSRGTSIVHCTVFMFPLRPPPNPLPSSLHLLPLLLPHLLLLQLPHVLLLIQRGF